MWWSAPWKTRGWTGPGCAHELASWVLGGSKESTREKHRPIDPAPPFSCSSCTWGLLAIVLVFILTRDISQQSQHQWITSTSVICFTYSVKGEIYTDVGTTGFALIAPQSWATAPASGREQRDTARLIYTYQIISQCPRFLEVSFGLVHSANPSPDPVPVDSSICFQSLPQFQAPPRIVIFLPALTHTLLQAHLVFEQAIPIHIYWFFFSKHLCFCEHLCAQLIICCFSVLPLINWTGC